MRKASNNSMWAVWALIITTATVSAQQPIREMPPGFDPKRHMSVDEVVPGMKGFGLSVFHGTQIETFDVEVISVQRGSDPGKAVVWMRGTDDRMQKLGLVQGMSGSPIYLYPRGVDPQRPDASQARLIGAFAFGYSLAGNDCYVGVQPIEHMLEAAQRAKVPSESDAPSTAGATGGNETALSLALAAAQKIQLPDRLTWRMKAIAQLTATQPFTELRPDQISRGSMAIPVMIGTPAMTEILGPMLQPMGLSAVASVGGMPAGLPPNWLSPDQVTPQPGGVGSIPLITGDMDAAAIGTITEILDDGTILAFGHAMFGRGELNLPWATGYVHFVQPNLQASFKVAGTLRVVGALVNDEASAVIAKPGVQHPYKPAVVHVDWPDDSKDRTFNYQIARNRTYTPIMAVVTVLSSILSDSDLPDFSTLHVDSTITFDGGRTLHITSLHAMSGANGVVYSLLPGISSLLDSPLGPVTLESMETTIRIEKKVRTAQVINATVQQTTVKPGGSIIVDMEFLPFRGVSYMHRMNFDVPKDLPEGQYALMIGGAEAYMDFITETRPHLMRINNIDEQFEMVQYIMNLKSDALYACLTTESPQVAVGRTELPQLPSSRAAIFLQPASSQATPYLPSVEKIQPMQEVIEGQMMVPILVQRQPQAMEDAPGAAE